MNDHDWIQESLPEQNLGKYKTKQEQLAEAQALLVKSSSPIRQEKRQKKSIGKLKKQKQNLKLETNQISQIPKPNMQIEVIAFPFGNKHSLKG